MRQGDVTGEQLLDSIEGTARRLSIGRSKVYELIKDGQLEIVKIGRTTRIPVDSAVALVQRLRGAV